MDARGRVLVAHNDPDLLMVLEHFLENAGFNTSTTRDGREAMSLIESHHFHAAVVGGRPRSVTYIQLLEKLRLSCASTVCVVLADSDRADLGDLHCLGVRAVISKWNLKDVVDTLRAISPGRQPGSIVGEIRNDAA